jgi:hypothetical protein
MKVYKYMRMYLCSDLRIKGFEEGGFNCGFTLPFKLPKRAAGKPAFDKSSDSTSFFAHATKDKCATPDKSAGKFWFGRPASRLRVAASAGEVGGVGKEKKLGSLEKR